MATRQEVEADIKNMNLSCNLEQALLKILSVTGIDGTDGDDGEDGNDGAKGDKPAHNWQDTSLRFENPDGSMGNFVDLQGEPRDLVDNLTSTRVDAGLTPNQGRVLNEKTMHKNPQGDINKLWNEKGELVEIKVPNTIPICIPNAKNLDINILEDFERYFFISSIDGGTYKNRRNTANGGIMFTGRNNIYLGSFFKVNTLTKYKVSYKLIRLNESTIIDENGNLSTTINRLGSDCYDANFNRINTDKHSLFNTSKILTPNVNETDRGFVILQGFNSIGVNDPYLPIEETLKFDPSSEYMKQVIQLNFNGLPTDRTLLYDFKIEILEGFKESKGSITNIFDAGGNKISTEFKQGNNIIDEPPFWHECTCNN